LKAPKHDQSISTYLLDINKIIDTLAANRSPLTNEEHLEAIFYGLSVEYKYFITIVTSHLDPCTVEDIEALLMAHEERLERYKTQDQLLPQANLASTQSSSNHMSIPMYGFHPSHNRGSHPPFRHNNKNKRLNGPFSPLAFSANYVRSLVILL